MDGCKFDCVYLTDYGDCETDKIPCEWDKCPGWESCDQCLRAETCSLKN